MKTAQEKQGYRVKTAQPVCGNCVHKVVVWPLEKEKFDSCEGIFPVDLIYGTCKLHEWRK